MVFISRIWILSTKKQFQKKCKKYQDNYMQNEGIEKIENTYTTDSEKYDAFFQQF